MFHKIPYSKLVTLIKTALEEDAYKNDITTNSVIPDDMTCTARIIAEQKCIISGIIILEILYEKIVSGVAFHKKKEDGEESDANEEIVRLEGNAEKILSTERTALNFLHRMSSVATYTKKFVDIARKYNVAVYDTRKTMPCLRAIDKYAVSTAGGKNHRFDLSEEFFFKENHFALLKTLNKEKLVAKINSLIKKNRNKKFIAEVQNSKQLKFWLDFGIDVILLDNMTHREIKKIVSSIKKSSKYKKVQIEASGGINLTNIEKICKCGVDRVSLGCITASPPPVHFSLEIF